jgi:hypothetical protein
VLSLAYDILHANVTYPAVELGYALRDEFEEYYLETDKLVFWVGEFVSYAINSIDWSRLGGYYLRIAKEGLLWKKNTAKQLPSENLSVNWRITF